MRRAIVGAPARRALCWLVAAVVVLQAFGPLALRAMPRAHHHPASSMPAGNSRIDLNAVLAHAPGLGHAHAHLAQHAHDAGSDAIDADTGDAGSRSVDLQVPLPTAAIFVAMGERPQLRPPPRVCFRSRTTLPLDEPPRG